MESQNKHYKNGIWMANCKREMNGKLTDNGNECQSKTKEC